MKPGVGMCAVLGAALLLAPAAPAADRDAIQRAVDGGVGSLKRQQQPDGTWRHSEIGATALAGLALLESGVKADDPAIKNAAKAVREQSVGLNKTYSLSLSIMFLDRLGDPADDELIDSMAVRLLAGQEPTLGGWTYTCPSPTEAEMRRLRALLEQRHEPAARTEPPEAPKGRPSVQDLPREIQEQLQLVGKQQAAAGVRNWIANDNSNTQFAVLALWIARRKGIPVETSMQWVDARFRASQEPDGGWGYMRQMPIPGAPPVVAPPEPPGSRSSAAMTCAGLLGLALSHGSAMETTLRTGPAGGAGAPARKGTAPDISKDPAVRAGLLALGAAIARPNQGGPLVATVQQPRVYYFLFSLERVAMAYGLETIGDKNWYDWGADFLLRKQNNDGSWTGEFADCGADTAFALLFLRRANLVQDLTATLKGRVADPGKRELRAVGIGDLSKPPAVDPKETRPAPAAADPEVARLSDELVKAGAGGREQALRKLRDSKGPVYTDALAHAIRRLDGDARGKARDALADRMARMTAATLKDKLQDEDAEIRRAAALASAIKDEKAHVPRLIEMLEDPEEAVPPAAHAALKSLTQQDFGPAKGASRTDVAGAVAAWKEWWDKNGGR